MQPVSKLVTIRQSFSHSMDSSMLGGLSSPDRRICQKQSFRQNATGPHQVVHPLPESPSTASAHSGFGAFMDDSASEESIHEVVPTCTTGPCQSRQQSRAGKSLNSAFLDAVVQGDTAAARRLIRKGASRHCKAEGGNTALHISCMLGDLVMLKCLTEPRDTQLGTPNDQGDTPLHLACKFGHVKLTVHLLKRGAWALAENKDAERPGEEFDPRVQTLIRKAIRQVLHHSLTQYHHTMEKEIERLSGHVCMLNNKVLSNELQLANQEEELDIVRAQVAKQGDGSCSPNSFDSSNGSACETLSLHGSGSAHHLSARSDRPPSATPISESSSHVISPVSKPALTTTSPDHAGKGATNTAERRQALDANDRRSSIASMANTVKLSWALPRRGAH